MSRQWVSTLGTYAAFALLGALLLAGYQRWHEWRMSTARSMNAPAHTFEDLRDGIYRGDTTAYQELCTASLDFRYDTFLYEHILMANRHQYSPAYEHVYYALGGPYDSIGLAREWFDIDLETRLLMRYYLKKGAEAGENTAARLLNNIDTQEKLGSASPDTLNEG